MAKNKTTPIEEVVSKTTVAKVEKLLDKFINNLRKVYGDKFPQSGFEVTGEDFLLVFMGQQMAEEALFDGHNKTQQPN